MSSRDIPGTSRPLELDPNPTAKEHAEFERLEREHPNAEVPEKKFQSRLVRRMPSKESMMCSFCFCLSFSPQYSC